MHGLSKDRKAGAEETCRRAYTFSVLSVMPQVHLFSQAKLLILAAVHTRASLGDL